MLCIASWNLDGVALGNCSVTICRNCVRCRDLLAVEVLEDNNYVVGVSPCRMRTQLGISIVTSKSPSLLLSHEIG